MKRLTSCGLLLLAKGIVPGVRRELGHRSWLDPRPLGKSLW